MMLIRSWFVLVFIFLCSQQAIGKENPGWQKKLAATIVGKIKKQVSRNAFQSIHNKSHLNSYIIEFGDDPNYQNKKTWIDERGVLDQKMFDEIIIDEFDARLKEINNQEYWTSKNKVLYTVVVNNWELFLNNSVYLDRPISKLSDFKSNAAEKYDSLVNEMNLLPLAVQSEVKRDHPELQNVVIYLVARFRVYNDPNEKDKSIRPHRYYYSSFSEAILARKLLTVSNIKDLNADGLIRKNLEIIKTETKVSSSITLTLARHYDVPKGQTQILANALKQPLRIIVNDPNDPETSVYDYSNLITKDETLGAIKKLCSGLRQTNGNDGVRLKVFHTDYRMDQSTLTKIQQYIDDMGGNDIAIWLHLNDESIVQYGIHFGPGLKARLTKNFYDHLEDFVSESIKYAHQQTIPYVKCAVFVAEQLSKVIGMTIIEPRFYDPALQEYDPGLFIAYYIGRTGADAGLTMIFQTLSSAEDDVIDKIKDGAWKDYQEKQHEFALITGLWNGVVTEVKGLPDVAKLLCDAYSDPPTMDEVNGVINAIFINGQAYDAIVGQLKNRYSTEQYSDYAILHHSASDFVSVAIMFIGVGELTGAAKTSELFAKFSSVVNLIDFLSLSRYVVGTVRGLTIYKLAMKNTKYFFTLAKVEAKTLIKVVNAAGDILKNTDLTILRQIEIQTDKGIIKATALVDPSDDLSRAMVHMKQVVKDAYGNRVIEFTDEFGEKHIVVEANDASKLVDDAGELATLLQKLESKLPTDELKAAFRADFGDDIEMLRRFDGEEGLFEGWKSLKDAPASIRKGIKSLSTVSKFANEGISLTFDAIEDGVRILNKNGDEVGKILKEGSEEILEISDDFIVSASISSTKLEGIKVTSNSGEIFNSIGFVKNTDGSIGFVEDVSTYGSQIVQNTIKRRGALRSSLRGVKTTEDAHHIFAVQSLKENQYVKKGVEGGFEFNTSVNGIPLEKYVKATNKGRHGPHPNLTRQIDEHMNWWGEQVVNGVKNKNLSPLQTAEYMRVIAEDVKQTISITTTKLNDLDLGLNHF